MTVADLSAQLTAYEGRPAVLGGRGRDPVGAAMIRHWCEAMGVPEPGVEGEAPPAMLQVWIMGGLSGAVGRTAAYEELVALLDRAGCTAVVATDCEQEYLRPLRTGDEITFDAVIESVSSRKTTALGTGHFITTRTEIRANGELAGIHRFRVLRYAPVRTKPASAANDAPAPAERPRPVINRDNAGFWEGVAGHRLLIQRCTACGRQRFPWLPGCGECGSPLWEAVEASGEGVVFSYVVMHHPPVAGFDAPYAVGLIELVEGVRMISNVVGVEPGRIRIGMPVTLEFVRDPEASGGQELPVFRAYEEGL
ncbi:bifunctional MaoC family dehydratase N-terminal/OB-fold nucleic acid binding domain-containing protein [Streptomyces hesseae]|uniref:Bifunctional MaoC family dehydratase N-terminal/OB-fold nucleic acid binding domain-containing protein n=1 Tax=Streptomyces hesseae TaxID=3075519 RepID=A0ABU2SSJ5_9ACTN|nr:bifunctional MaoC family dehydratase N-terminal/OB-fold nucleic acid binding domain-containing protein [Streptomyces sp. DSM 40473]MDT0451973.1 bifunctional MaoC family dehydratase N-terminal/OB-fold nucleic acid binding domain-containing protein [Streptomyces sp. DSM 40473]